MPDTSTGRPDRNWYKISTIMLTVAMLIVMFMSGIYYRRVDDRRERVRQVETKIDELTQRKQTLELQPTVEVTLLSLEASGFPVNAFADLTEIPAVIKVKHVSGTTAKGISVQISAPCKIISFRADPSVEVFDTKLDVDNGFFTLEIDKLRRNSAVTGILRLERVTPLTLSSRIDNGVFTHEIDEEKKSLFRFVVLNQLKDIDPLTFHTAKLIDEVMESLRRLRRYEANKPILIIWPADSFLFWILAPLVIWILLVSGFLYHIGRKYNELGNRIGSVMTNGLLKKDMHKNDVEQLLGLPRKVRHVEVDGQDKEIWEYIPSASPFFGWQPDVYFTFDADLIERIEFREYGKRTYPPPQSQLQPSPSQPPVEGKT